MPIERKCSQTIVEAMKDISSKMAMLEKSAHECMTHKDKDACQARLELLETIRRITGDYEEDILETCR